ncbi:MAG: hypothetical protein J0L99_15150 [Chitinophagales bacterium]|nr:hypothetical protein [Chitinophagales bacterium]
MEARLSPIHTFVWEHRADDPADLALQARKYPGLQMPYIASQVAAYQKIKHKIPEWYRPGLAFPFPLSLEQASSEASARFKASLFSGAHSLDLTGGLGVDSYFLSQRFKIHSYVEQNHELLVVTAQNFGRLEASNVHFAREGAEAFLENTEDTFNLIYLDPARRDAKGGRVAGLEDCAPNVLELLPRMLELAQDILLKASPMLDIQQALRQLGEGVQRVYVVAYEEECKEVLFHIGRQKPDHLMVHAVTLQADGQVVHCFEGPIETSANAPKVEFGLGQYLYEPNVAIRKAGFFNTFAQRYGLKKIQANTHLYCADELLPDIPGRSFVIEAICSYDKKAIAPYCPEGKANIAAKNFPDDVAAIRKKSGLKDGGNRYLFAVTDAAGKKVILVCKKAGPTSLAAD